MATKNPSTKSAPKARKAPAKPRKAPAKKTAASVDPAVAKLEANLEKSKQRLAKKTPAKPAKAPAKAKAKPKGNTYATMQANNTGASAIENPVQAMWDLCDKMQKEKRKTVIEAAVAKGISYYTARTQYQLWLTAFRNS